MKSLKRVEGAWALHSTLLTQKLMRRSKSYSLRRKQHHGACTNSAYSWCRQTQDQTALSALTVKAAWLRLQVSMWTSMPTSWISSVSTTSSAWACLNSCYVTWGFRLRSQSTPCLRVMQKTLLKLYFFCSMLIQRLGLCSTSSSALHRSRPVDSKVMNLSRKTSKGQKVLPWLTRLRWTLRCNNVNSKPLW